MAILIILLVLAALYVLALRCRKGHPLMPQLRKWSYAHRGLHGKGVPENSMAAFRLALEKGYGIELDIHLTADGQLAVIHDSSLKRTAGADVHIEDLTAADLPDYRLEGTEEHIPLFQDVLELFDGKAPLIVELKAERGNHAALTEAACKMLESYRGLYCVESFDPRCIQWLKNNRPDIVRGQLAEDFFGEKKSGLSFGMKLLLTNLLLNFLTVPDFVAYKFADRNGLAPTLCRKVWGAQGVSWTLRSKQDHDTAVKEGQIPIFEHFEP